MCLRSQNLPLSLYHPTVQIALFYQPNDETTMYPFDWLITECLVKVWGEDYRDAVVSVMTYCTTRAGVAKKKLNDWRGRLSMNGRKVVYDAFGLSCDANPRLKYDYSELVSDEQRTLRKVYELEGVKPLVKGGMLRWHWDDELNRPFATGLGVHCCTFGSPSIRLSPSAQSPRVLLAAPCAGAFTAARLAHPQSASPLPPNPPVCCWPPLVQGRSLLHVWLTLNPPLPFLPIPPCAVGRPLCRGVHCCTFGSPSIPLSPSSQSPRVLLAAPCAGAFTAARLAHPQSPSPLPPNPPCAVGRPLCRGVHCCTFGSPSIPLSPSSQSPRVLLAAPCAGAFTAARLAHPQSPSPLPPNPPVCCWPPLVQGRSLLHVWLTLNPPLPFLPIPPCAVGRPLCRGVHCCTFGSPSIPLSPSSQSPRVLLAAPCAGAFTAARLAHPQSPSPLPPNPPVCCWPPLVQGRSLLHVWLTLNPPLPFLPTPRVLLAAPCAGAFTAARLAHPQSPSPLPPNPPVCCWPPLVQGRSLLHVWLTLNPPLPFLPIPPCAVGRPLCRGVHCCTFGSPSIPLSPSSQSPRVLLAAPFAGAFTAARLAHPQSPSPLPPNPPVCCWPPLVQGRSLLHVWLTLNPPLPFLPIPPCAVGRPLCRGVHCCTFGSPSIPLSPSSQSPRVLLAAPCAGAFTAARLAHPQSPSPLPPNPPVCCWPPLVQGRSLLHVWLTLNPPLPFRPTPPCAVGRPLCRGVHCCTFGSPSIPLSPSSQSPRVLLAAPCAGAFTAARLAHPQSPSPLPPNPPVCCWPPLVQGRSLLHVWLTLNPPLPFRPIPPCAVGRPLCRGVHCCTFGSPSIPLSPSSQSPRVLLAAPCAGAFTAARLAHPQSPSPLPPNPPRVLLAAPCAGAFTAARLAHPQSPSPLPPNPPVCCWPPLVQGRSLLHVWLTLNPPLPFRPTPPCAVGRPLCRGVHCCTFGSPSIPLSPSAQPPLVLLAAPCAGAFTAARLAHPQSPSPLPPNPPVCCWLPLVQGRSLLHVWLTLNPPLPFRPIPPCAVGCPLCRGVHCCTFGSPSIPLSPSAQPPRVLLAAPCAGAFTAARLAHPQSPSPLPPNPPVCCWLPLVQGRSLLHVWLTLNPPLPFRPIPPCAVGRPLCRGVHCCTFGSPSIPLSPSAQSPRVLLAAPCAGAFTAARLAHPQSPSPLPANPPVCCWPPLVQGRSLLHVWLTLNPPLPFLPIPPCAVGRPLCRGVHCCTFGSPSIPLSPSSQSPRVLLAAPCAGAFTAARLAHPQSPSPLPPNPPVCCWPPLVQGRSLLHVWLTLNPPLPFLPIPPCAVGRPLCRGVHCCTFGSPSIPLSPSSQTPRVLLAAPCAGAFTAARLAHPQSPSPLPPNPPVCCWPPLVQGRSLLHVWLTLNPPLPFRPTPPCAVGCPLCRGVHCCTFGSPSIPLSPSAQSPRVLFAAPCAGAFTAARLAHPQSPSPLPPNPPVCCWLPLVQGRSLLHVWLTLNPPLPFRPIPPCAVGRPLCRGVHCCTFGSPSIPLSPSSQSPGVLLAAPCAGAFTAARLAHPQSPSPLPPNPPVCCWLPLVQGRSLLHVWLTLNPPLPFLPIPPCAVGCPLCRGVHCCTFGSPSIPLSPSSQSPRVLLAAPCAGAFTAARLAHPQSPSPLPPNPPVCCWLPLVQGRSPLHVWLTLNPPLPFRPVPPCAVGCPLCRGVHRCTFGSPSIPLSLSS
ncbi:unnamed protein product [Closterium sp. Yama58-4]|nr:unnamed protein product [Closterium sp. Yama58-4]